VSYGGISALLGFIMVASWLFSNHEVLQHNANLFLFWPTDAVFAFWAFKKFPKTWALPLKRYSLVHLVSLSFLTLAFLTGWIEQNVSWVLLYMAPVSLAAFFYAINPTRDES
jgi:hypothetical protein